MRHHHVTRRDFLATGALAGAGLSVPPGVLARGRAAGLPARLFNSEDGLFGHAWFADMDDDARFYWGRGDGWMMMAMAELLSVMPDSHPDRAKVLEIFRRGARSRPAFVPTARSRASV